jgi:hypothetical protein
VSRLITNPMILKELRQRLRERRAWLLPTLYLLVLAGTVSFAYFASADVERRGAQQEVQGAAHSRKSKARISAPRYFLRWCSRRSVCCC